MTETQLCKLRGTQNTLIGRACTIFHDMLYNIVFLNGIYDVVVDTSFHKFHGSPFARVLYVLAHERYNMVYKKNYCVVELPCTISYKVEKR